jgi:uncharacterized repeat protein (TIGR03943 family)
VRRSTQGLALLFLGVVLIRLAVGDAYLSYVTSWMKWPIIVSGVLLAALAIRPILGLGGEHDEHDHDGHEVPLVTWLLLLPGLVVFTISPPALGAFLAERRADDGVSATQVSTFAPLPAADAEGEAVEVDLEEFVWRSQVDDGVTLVGREVRIDGFVSLGQDGDWYVTRLSIACCAADARVVRLGVDGAEAPERDSWVRLEGTWVDGTGTDREDPPRIAATDVAAIEAPRQTYE